MKRFSKINIEISNICNLKCSFCPDLNRPRAHMDSKLFEDVIKQVHLMTEQVCFHLMGEPLLHPELRKLVEICQKYEVRIFFVTNGVALTQEAAQLLLHPSFRQVNFSLHSFTDNFCDKDPSTYLKQIFDFTNRAFEDRPDLYINYRLWNLDCARGASVGCLDLIRRVETHFDVMLPKSPDVTKKKSFRLKNRLYAHFDTEFVWPDAELPVVSSTGTCYGMSSHFGILVDGTVVPCCLDKDGKIPLGNVKDRPISEILSSDRGQAMLTGFAGNKLVEPLCQRCHYIDRFS